MKTRLLLVRHAEAIGNVSRHFHGWTDSPITEKGHLQAKLLADHLKDEKIDVIYSSSLQRTLQTAGYISKAKDLPIIRTDKLKEINGGDWEGKSWEDLGKIFPEEYYTWEFHPHIHSMPNGENMYNFQQRIVDEVQYIINNNKGKSICIVTHGTAIKTLMCYFKGCSLEEMLNISWYDNTSLTIVELFEEKFDIILEGDTSHLDKETSTISNQDWWIEAQKKFDSHNSKEKIISWLFETSAIRVCSKDKPFWYTSGTIGPYYINTHFLFGNEAKANELLTLIDTESKDKLECPLAVLEHTKRNYSQDPIYKGLIDAMCSFIDENIGFENIDYISGGERRDWFFSLIIADLIGKPHITIYKDMKTVVGEMNSSIDDLSHKDEATTTEMLKGKKVLHIADLITEASSYSRAWLPAVRGLGGEIKWSLVVVDRMQGGAEFLETEGVKSFAMIEIDKGLFDKAFKMGLINEQQHKMVIAYIENPKAAMRSFLVDHPEFIQNALDEGGKGRERALLCLEKDFYGLETDNRKG